MTQSSELVLSPSPGLENSEANLIRRQKQSVEIQDSNPSWLPKCFVVCERSTGAARFQIEADPDGGVPVEKIASMLAVHCLMRGQSPEDFELLVAPRRSLLDEAAGRAQELLAAGRALGAGVKVSRREQEVLDGVLQNLANKEIAVRLNVSERTVKFHVSSLLAKFGVTDRIALSREATLGPMAVRPAAALAGTLFGFAMRKPGPVNADAADTEQIDAEANAPREIRARQRAIPMFARERFAT